MKIKYEFANETVEIEVDEKWADVLCEMDRQEHNNERCETRRHSSIQEMDPEGVVIPSDANVEQDVLSALESEALRKAISLLTPRQQYLVMQYFFCDRTYGDLAEEEGVDESAVRHAVQRALEKMKKIMI